MEKAVLNKINRSVYKRFPEMEGVKPKKRKLGESVRLTYTAEVLTEDGKKLKRVVQVVATEQGKILKITTSR